MSFTIRNLTFQGSKRGRWLSFVGQWAKNVQEPIIVDAFGGSGNLSLAAKYYAPDKTVIYNDFDNFLERVEHFESDTRPLIQALYESLLKQNVLRDSRVDFLKPQLRKLLQDHIRQGRYIDIVTLSRLLHFSTTHRSKTLEKLFARRWYFRAPLKTHATKKIHTEFSHLQVKREDFKTLLDKYAGRAAFLLDPPYFQTSFACYAENLLAKDFFHLLAFLSKNNFPALLFDTDATLVQYILEFFGTRKVERVKRKVCSGKGQIRTEFLWIFNAQ